MSNVANTCIKSRKKFYVIKATNDSFNGGVFLDIHHMTIFERLNIYLD